MTVEQLIRKLRRFPKDFKVGVAHHDNREDELAGIISDIDLLAPGEMLDWHGDVVVLRT